MPAAGAKKVKTTKELLEEIQSRGSKPATSPPSPASPASPDVMLIEPDACVKIESPLRNGGASPPRARPPSPPLPPLEDAREPAACTCGTERADDACPAAARARVLPLHVAALHHVYLPGVNGTRAPLAPHRFAVRPAADPARPGLFASVVPLYNYSDYADDRCAKNMARVPLCERLPWTEFAPPPPDPPPPPSPPPVRPYPLDPEPTDADDAPAIKTEVMEEPADGEEPTNEAESEIKVKIEVEKEAEIATKTEIEAEPIGVPCLEPGERLKAPLLTADDETQFERGEGGEGGGRHEAELDVAAEQRDHRTVERTKAEPADGRALCELCRRAIADIPYDYEQLSVAPVVTLPEPAAEAESALGEALARAEAETERDELCRPARPPRFAEWHECVQLGSLLALPYVVID